MEISRICPADLINDVVLKGGHTPGHTLDINPSYSAYSTPVMWCMALGSRVGDGYVGCGGLDGGLWR